MKPEIAVLVLAAGGSSRIGRPKQLLSWGKTTLLGHALNQAKALKEADCFVVLGANSEIIQQSLDLTELNILFHKDWSNGIGSSISFSINFIKSTNNYKSILILLADQPLITTSYLQSLIAMSIKHPNKIVASQYQSTIGVPAIFPNNHFSKLKSLSGDIGAKRLINQHKKNVVGVEVLIDLTDVDTMEVYERLVNEHFY